MGQNERTANYGTSVESCSDNSRSAPAVKLRISPSTTYNDGNRILPKIADNFFEKGREKTAEISAADGWDYLISCVCSPSYKERIYLGSDATFTRKCPKNARSRR